MIEGFCIIEKTDVPVDGDRRCLTDGMVTTPPSWGKRGMRWTDGGWEGDTGRPKGYVYRPKFTDGPQAQHAVETRDCGHCGASFTATVRGGSAAAYCSGICRNRAASIRRRIVRTANLRQYAGAAS